MEKKNTMKTVKNQPQKKKKKKKKKESVKEKCL